MGRRVSQSVARSCGLPSFLDGIGSGRSIKPSNGVAWWHAFFNAADGAFAMLSDGRITFWNPAAERITGYAVGEVLGRHCCEVFVLHEAGGERSCSSKCRSVILNKQSGPIESFDLQISSKDGRLIWLNMSTVIPPVADAQSPRVIRMFREVTAVRDVLALIRGRLAGSPTSEDVLGRLTRREAEVLRLLISGASNRALADRLHISPATARNHTHNIFEKLGVGNRLAAVTLALRQFQY